MYFTPPTDRPVENSYTVSDSITFRDAAMKLNRKKFTVYVHPVGNITKTYRLVFPYAAHGMTLDDLLESEYPVVNIEDFALAMHRHDSSPVPPMLVYGE